jgi:hypothetical protein
MICLMYGATPLENAAAAKSVWSLAAKSLFFGMTCDAAQLSDVEL